MRPIEIAKKKEEDPVEEEEEEGEEVDPQAAQSEMKRKRRLLSAFQTSKQQEQEEKPAKQKKERSPSPDDTAPGSLMTEAQAKAMMGRKKRNTQEEGRGSLRAKARIQREMDEWETAKQNNPEYWK